MPTPETLHDLASKFFREFSRLEYSLKACGYNNGDGPAEANWSRFARAIEQAVANSTDEVKQDIDFLLSEPPKKQFINAGVMEWRSAPANTGSRSDDLFVYIRRVRNNLFHGGKFNGNWFAPERSEMLMSASLTVMRWAVTQDQRVFEAYNGQSTS